MGGGTGAAATVGAGTGVGAGIGAAAGIGALLTGATATVGSGGDMNAAGAVVGVAGAFGIVLRVWADFCFLINLKRLLKKSIILRFFCVKT